MIDLVGLFVAVASAFCAGYWRGRVIEQRETMKIVDRLAKVNPPTR